MPALAFRQWLAKADEPDGPDPRPPGVGCIGVAPLAKMTGISPRFGKGRANVVLSNHLGMEPVPSLGTSGRIREART